jgi:hydrogenase maturation protease
VELALHATRLLFIEMNLRYNSRREGGQLVRPVVIIGLGNSLRQDDGLGPAVVERLSARINDPRVELLAPMTLTPELAATIWKARRVIFIDACVTLAPGEIEHRSVEWAPQADVSLVHSLSPEALLVWTGRVYGCVPMAEIWLMGVQHTGLSEDLTPVVAGKLNDLVHAVERRIHQALSDDAPIDTRK